MQATLGCDLPADNPPNVIILALVFECFGGPNIVLTFDLADLVIRRSC